MDWGNIGLDDVYSKGPIVIVGGGMTWTIKALVSLSNRLLSRQDAQDARAEKQHEALIEVAEKVSTALAPIAATMAATEKSVDGLRGDIARLADKVRP